ncbi:peptidase G2 autoproteolytic cleavage domain-containing protein [Paenibacillus xanthanilyticus]|uniref:Peptidase G2 autoproteolytic cleavage domain-containing protein n=1 Tax=Paenibacillus xanthanilyticus TaxID=1783531 RepID=A0ABV8K5Z0_9BACL
MAECNAQAAGACSEAEGSQTIASGAASHAEGYLTQSIGPASHAEGGGSAAAGVYAHAEGEATRAPGDNAHAEGFGTAANASSSHAEGYLTQAGGPGSHAEGGGAIASGLYAHAEGNETRAMGAHSHAEGQITMATGFNAHAEGELTQASGLDSHAEGMETIASGQGAHAEGERNTASGRASHAEGNLNTASGIAAHAEGQRALASGDLSHAEGSQTIASGQGAHAEGLITTASGLAAHAQGALTVADGLFSHAQGLGTQAAGLDGVHVMGRFGIANEESYSWYLANGNSELELGIAAKILSSGNVKIDGALSTPAADYAEMFETADGKPIEPGYFVAFEAEKVRIAQPGDRYIAGVTSARPAIVADSGELRWEGKYVTDEWGRIVYRDEEAPGVLDRQGQTVVPGRRERRPVLNPAWDPTIPYTPRAQRPEWVAVGMLGKLLVRDDGSCQAGRCCVVGEGGIATDSENGYYVLKRTGARQILIMLGITY